MISKADQIQMIWPIHLLAAPPTVTVPPGYILRTHQPGDETAFFGLMASVGWAGWEEERLRPWLYRILPEGWFFAVEQASGEIVATCMATHDPTWLVPFCGEVGWTATAPEHQGKGLGRAVVSAVVRRFLQAGYQTIHLYTEVWRTAAVGMYLKCGFEPYFEFEDDHEKWAEIYRQVKWSGSL